MRSLFNNLAPVKAASGPETTESIILSMVARSVNGTVAMPPGIAKRVLEELNFPHQRDRRARRLAKHLHRLTAGTWRGSFPITFARLPDGRLWLVDGQHRLSAIVEHDSPAPIRVILADVASEQEARMMYAGFDEPDSSRSANEVIGAVGLIETLGVKRETASDLYRALPLLLNNLETTKGFSRAEKAPEVQNMDNRLEAIGKWAVEARKYEAIIGLADTFIRRKMRGAGCMALALYTFRHQPTRAAEFWTGLAQNDGLKKNDARARLIADMMQRALNSGSSRQTVQQPAMAWNAWNEGRELKIIKCVDGAPITVWGTPLAKGRA